MVIPRRIRVRFKPGMEDNTKDSFYQRPPKLGKWVSFKLFFYNSKTGQFLGRTPSSWAKILFFYCCFYAVLIGFTASMLAIFYQTLDMKVPKLQLDSSLIGSNPGLGFRPMPPHQTHAESTLVWFDKSDSKSYDVWKTKIYEFLKPYDITPTGDVMDCNGQPPTENKVCYVNLVQLQTCSNREEDYGYKHGTPCIFLKLNKIYNWVPKYYTNPEELPEKMPQDLKNYIRNNSDIGKMVWISCEGENPADVENIGSIQYFPHRGFQSIYFPYKNQPGYLSPIVAIWFEQPQTGVLINIECKAWAKNIVHDREYRRGSVHFELMVD